MHQRIIIVCPGKRKTGGVELLHQMMDAINATTDNDARLLYIPSPGTNQLLYPEYTGSLIPQHEVTTEDIIVLPETMTHLRKRFARHRIVVWWLSVDNYFGSQTLRYMAANRINPLMLSSLKELASSVEVHLTQSFYAQDFLHTNGIRNTQRLSDYLADEYLAARYSLQDKEDIICYNPAKDSREFSEFRRTSGHEFVPLKGMSRPKIIETLKRAKIYIDFGNHPGMDRIPREAAILGSVVITGKRGSAAFSEDLPIGEKYKIPEGEPSFNGRLNSMISSILKNFSECHHEMSDYREFIQIQKADFYSCIRNFSNLLDHEK